MQPVDRTMMTPQQNADILLRIWQEHRALPPEDRIEALMADFSRLFSLARRNTS